MKPWHLHSEDERELVLMDLDAYSKRTGWTRRFAAVYQAAAALLRDAAPWPDEALVVEWDSRIWEVIDAHGDGVLELRSESASSFSYYRYCLPLTPAAAEFLAAMGGGE